MKIGDSLGYALLGLAIIVLFIFTFILFDRMTAGGQDAETIREAERILDEFDEVSTSYRLLEYFYEKNDSCGVLMNQLLYLEDSLWRLGNEIESYNDPNKKSEGNYFYLSGKRRVNRWEVTHFSMLSKVKNKCGLNQTIILYFYGECRKNNKCNEQGLELDSIRSSFGTNVSVFSFDADLNTSAVNSLITAYKVDALPCIVIDGETHCKFMDSGEITNLICPVKPNLPACIGRIQT